MGDFFGGFVQFIMSLIKYIQELVGYFRASNDGKDPEFPSFPDLPSVGGDDAGEGE